MPKRSIENASIEYSDQSETVSKHRRLDNGRVFGLKQVFPSPDDVNATDQKMIDIIILHGLFAQSPKTWIAWKEYDVPGSGDVNWTSDANMLPEALPEARIMTYDWNADYDKTASSDIFLGHADTLLDRIHVNRERTNRLDRPIIFVASCFGGLLLAKALVRAADIFPFQGKLNLETLRQVVGVTFLGTPFRGNWKAGYEAASLRLAIAQNTAAEEGVEYSGELIQYLQLGTPGRPGPLAETVRRFTEMVSNNDFKFPIVCFYETRHTKFRAVLAKLPQDYVQAQIKEDSHGIVVEQFSACLDGAECVALDVRHNMLHKFDSPNDDGFLRLASRLSRFARNASYIIGAKGIITIITGKIFQTPQERSSPAHSEIRSNPIRLTCKCQYRRRISRQSSQWRNFTHFNESIIGLYHEPGCPRYKDGGGNREHTVGIMYQGLSRLFNIAIIAYFTKRSIAGGFSISPTLLYHAMVDNQASPAFRVVTRMAFGIVYMLKFQLEFDAFPKLHEQAENGCKQIINCGISSLKEIFISRSSSPNDTDQNGWTLIEALLNIVRKGTEMHITNPITELLNLGVPAMRNSWQIERSPLGAVPHIFDQKLRYEPMVDEGAVYKLLFKDQPENYVCKVNWQLLCKDGALTYLAKIESIREAFGLDHPVFTALLTKDEAMLKDSLPTTSDCLLSNGISAWHIAVFWPNGLELLLKHHSGADINMTCDELTPLDLALHNSGRICKGRWVTLCHNCDCAKSVEILLRKCHLTEKCLYHMGDRSLRYPSFITTHLLLSHIKSYRGKLMKLARKELGFPGKRDIDFRDSSVLDHAAPNIIRRLEARGISPSQKTNLNSGDFRLSSPSDGVESSSVYHYLGKVSALECAFELGFKDTDVFYHSKTPIMQDFLFLETYEWFLDHGACIMNIVPWNMRPAQSEKIPDWTVAHYIMVRAGQAVEHDDEIRRRSKSGVITRLTVRLSGSSTGDNCECGCSDLEDGCSPLNVFLHKALKKLSMRDSFIPSVILDSVKDIEREHTSMLSAIASTVIRACTFKVLKIRHTCCNTEFYPHLGSYVYGEDFPYIRDEDESLLDELENLMTEFKENFRPEKQLLSQFLVGYWKDRINEVLQEKNEKRLTQEDINGNTRIGVVLTEDRSEEDSPDEKSESWEEKMSLMLEREIEYRVYTCFKKG